jgi:hypothetical protein
MLRGLSACEHPPGPLCFQREAPRSCNAPERLVVLAAQACPSKDPSISSSSSSGSSNSNSTNDNNKSNNNNNDKSNN